MGILTNNLLKGELETDESIIGVRQTGNRRSSEEYKIIVFGIERCGVNVSVSIVNDVNAEFVDE